MGRDVMDHLEIAVLMQNYIYQVGIVARWDVEKDDRRVCEAAGRVGHEKKIDGQYHGDDC